MNLIIILIKNIENNRNYIVLKFLGAIKQYLFIPSVTLFHLVC